MLSRSLSLALVAVLAPVGSARQDALCAQVGLKLSQTAVITRTAFQATLTIDNAMDGALEEVDIDIIIKDVDGNLANDRFGIEMPLLTGIADVDGGGTIAPQSVATAEWLIIPGESAAPTVDFEVYTVSGTIRHLQKGILVEVPLYPVEIEVHPDAALFLKYFLQTPVYSDNPFTPLVVEPAEPFNLGLLVRNEGNGTAKNVRITSAQPEIVNNEKGLLVSFKLLATQVGLQAAMACLTVKLGDIPPMGSAVARWLMSSTIQGEFIEYDATFEHVSGLGDPSLSLIESVEIRELTHVVLVDEPGADGLPDFLARDPLAPPVFDPVSGMPLDGFPDELHGSDGQVLPVHPIVHGTVDAPPTPLDLSSFLTVDVLQPGWSYIRIDDPGTDLYELALVARMDPGGREPVSVGGPGDVANAWTTERYLPIDAPPTAKETLLHIFDYFPTAGTYGYDVGYVEAEPIPLVAGQTFLSISAGGQQDLLLDAGAAHANRPYLLLGSVTGTLPGIDLGPVNLPLLQDAYFDFTLTRPNSPTLVSSLGLLDGEGEGSARFVIAPGLSLPVGLTIYHAYVLFAPALDFASNAVQAVLIP